MVIPKVTLNGAYFDNVLCKSVFLTYLCNQFTGTMLYPFDAAHYQLSVSIPHPSNRVRHTSTKTTPIPTNTTKTLEKALNPTPATNPNTLPKLTCFILFFVRSPVPVFGLVLPCLESKWSSEGTPQPVSAAGASVR